MPRPLKAVPLDSDHLTIVCYYCERAQEVGRRTMSLPCRFCQRSLCVEDLVFPGYAAKRSIETCGSVLIEEAGHVIVERVRCSRLVLQGRLKGNVISRGPVVLEARAELRGDVVAPSLLLAEGARLSGHWTIGPALPPPPSDAPTAKGQSGQRQGRGAKPEVRVKCE